MRRLNVHERDGMLYIVPLSQTTAGLWIVDDPISVSNLDDAHLHELVIKTLELSKQGIPHPSKTEWKNVPKKLLDASKTKSWKEFSKGTRSLLVKEENGNCTFVPSQSTTIQPPQDKIRFCNLESSDFFKILLLTMSDAEAPQ